MSAAAVIGAVPLTLATDPARFGGKVASLAHAARAGLPVPDGVALDVASVAAVRARARSEAVALLGPLPPGPWAVRSSAPGEDGAVNSFAGQHLSVLNVTDPAGLIEAVHAVAASAESESAVAYRRHRGATSAVGCAVLVQRFLDAEIAGVLFTRDPLTGADEYVIEASWALGEAVVTGLVTPDRYRVSRTGAIRDVEIGSKDLAVVPAPSGGTQTRRVALDDIKRRCVSDAQLAALADLASRCREVFPSDEVEGRGHDLEWAFHAGALALLQRRPITT